MYHPFQKYCMDYIYLFFSLDVLPSLIPPNSEFLKNQNSVLVENVHD